MRIAKGKRITAHDGRALARFRAELQLLAKLEREGVPPNVAAARVFGAEQAAANQRHARKAR